MKIKKISVLITFALSSSFILSSCSESSFSSSSNKMIAPFTYRDKYITKKDCVSDWLDENLCIHGALVKELSDYKLVKNKKVEEIEKLKSEIDDAAYENQSDYDKVLNNYYDLDGYYGPLYDFNGRTNNGFSPTKNLSFFQVRFTSEKWKLFDLEKTDYGISKEDNKEIKEIKDVYKNFSDCEKDWINQDLCKKDGAVLTGAVYDINERQYNYNGVVYKPVSNNSNETIVMLENGESYKSNINPIDIKSVDKKRDVYGSLEKCLEDWKHEELCVKSEDSKYYIGPVYNNGMRTAKTSDNVVQTPAYSNALMWFLLFNNGRSFLSSNQSNISKSNHDGKVYATPFVGAITSSGLNADSKVSSMNSLTKAPYNSVAKTATIRSNAITAARSGVSNSGVSRSSSSISRGGFGGTARASSGG